jgi:hypothetical protein
VELGTGEVDVEPVQQAEKALAEGFHFDTGSQNVSVGVDRGKQECEVTVTITVRRRYRRDITITTVGSWSQSRLHSGEWGVQDEGGQASKEGRSIRLVRGECCDRGMGQCRHVDRALFVAWMPLAWALSWLSNRQWVVAQGGEWEELCEGGI